MAEKRTSKNWLAIRTAYVVQGWTAEKCAEQFGVHVTTVKKRASKEGWTQERTSNATKGGEVVAMRMREVVDEQIAQQAGAAQAAVDAQIELLALGSRIGSKLAQAAELLLDKYLMTATNVQTGELRPGIEPGEKQSEADVLNALADAARKAIMVGREIGGLEKGQPSVVTAVSDNEFIIERTIVGDVSDVA